MEFIFQKKIIFWQTFNWKSYFWFLEMLCYSRRSWHFTKKHDDVSLIYEMPLFLFTNFASFSSHFEKKTFAIFMSVFTFFKGSYHSSFKVFVPHSFINNFLKKCHKLMHVVVFWRVHFSPLSDFVNRILLYYMLTYVFLVKNVQFF